MRRKFPDENEVEGDSYGEPEDSESHQPDVGGNLGRVGGGQRDGGDGAGGGGDWSTGAGGGLEFLTCRADTPTDTAAAGLVPHPGGVQGTAVLGLAVFLLTGTPALPRVKPLLDSAVLRLQEAGTPARRPVVLQLYTSADLRTVTMSGRF